jgi:mRNA interferase MazF
VTRLERGTVVLLGLDPTRGHEQRGVRPCVVVSDPEVIADQRFPVLCVVPISGTAGEGALYPALKPGPSGLTKPSFALVDQLRSVDKRRVIRVFGTVRPSELDAVDEGIRLFLGLEAPRRP